METNETRFIVILDEETPQVEAADYKQLLQELPPPVTREQFYDYSGCNPPDKIL